MKILTQKTLVREDLRKWTTSCLKIFEREFFSILSRIRYKMCFYFLNICWVVMNFSKREIF